ncbi:MULTISPECIES: flagellar basal body L-ring protein FlgH [Microbulbifer]|uniref:flagellar basal body L-ring protein FlgH n=1 Tax=Microbulbifer TaxID=48073 RepID=UPI001E39A65F|nr:MULTISPECIES: flagellar basal body L-ring protein FlgH [Microbulbifer]UHQ56901.1 flagellar basal body L-ring protein FlgH [Microbulbifer sp. YPW16]
MAYDAGKKGVLCLILMLAPGLVLANGGPGFEAEPEEEYPEETGSLYSEETYQSLVEDHRARFLGDTLTVLIHEAASATSKADTDTEKNSKISVRASDTHNTVGGDFRGSSEFDGGGVERRSGEVIGKISTTVEAILPNGELFVRGQQVISLNNEAQTIFVEGRVRPEDISADNTILSTRLADSNIKFQGDGLLSRKETPGLISRALEWLF